MQKFSLRVAGRTVPQLKFSKHLVLSETIHTRKLVKLLGMQVNMYKANSRRFAVTGRWYIRVTAKIRNPQISV